METHIYDESSHKVMNLSFVYKSKTFQICVASDTTLYELGQNLEVLIGVVPHTLRLLLPRSRALLPFSDHDGVILLQQSGISEGRSIRVLGVLPEEFEQVSQEANQKYERGVIGFDDEDKRAKQRAVFGADKIIQLPKGKYVFCDFKTLELPGIELQPPASKALEIMHKLASDPGIVAIMNKHHWTVGIMTEMAPEGYVGISPECVLGYNKNKGEEISLRIRTDDLKGFRKYDSIKKTLLHELAHMVHSNHDANFHALNKQLNEEAASLDWTKSTSHNLGGFNFTDVDYAERSVSARKGQKLGGSNNYNHFGARSAAAQAALSRLSEYMSDLSEKKDKVNYEFVQTDRVLDENVSTISEEIGKEIDQNVENVRDLDENMVEFYENPLRESEISAQNIGISEESMNEDSEKFPRGIDGNAENIQVLDLAGLNAGMQDTNCGTRDGLKSEPDPDLSVAAMELDEGLRFQEENESVRNNYVQVSHDHTEIQPSGYPDGSSCNEGIDQEQSNNFMTVFTRGNSKKNTTDTMNVPSNSLKVDYTPNDSAFSSSIEDMNLKAVQENTEMLCRKIQDAIILLKQEATQAEAMSTIQTLSRIIRNIKEHPNEAKFRCLKKETSTFRQKIAKFRGALEILHAMGFSGGINNDGSEGDFLVLKRDDPVLLWLAQSSLEACIA